MLKKLQEKFEEFHSNIKLDFDDNAKLREKRDLLISELEEWLKVNAKKLGVEKPTFTYFNQGSYAVGLGIKPLQGDDYDIDVALIFNFSKEDVEAFLVKQCIEWALTRHNRKVFQKRPCVTVQYHKDGSESFHVDFAAFSGSNYNEDGKNYLARGKNKETQFWEESDPKKLINLINSAFSDGDSLQFKRVIRDKKRWKDFNFVSEGYSRPIGIAITACALKWFKPVISKEDGKEFYNDCQALKNLVQKMLDAFSYTFHKGEFAERLVVTLPIPPGNDLFEKMSNIQMKDFKTKLTRLKNSLDNAINANTLREACIILNKEFGDDFIIPEEPVEDAKDLNRAFVQSSLVLGSAKSTSQLPVANRGGFHGK